MAESALLVRHPATQRKILFVETFPLSGVFHLGVAAPGAATNAAVWMIQKITTVNDNLTVEFADGDAEFDNVWDDRASLSYN